MWSSKIGLKSVKFSFHFSNCMHHFHSYILQKTPLKLFKWFQIYEQLKDAKNNRKQKTFSALFGSILKSIFATSDWFCLITSHISVPFRNFVHSVLHWGMAFPFVACSSDDITSVLLFQNELLVDVIEFVSPLILIHAVLTCIFILTELL